MQTHTLNEAARTENARALSAALGIDQASAAIALDISILVTYDHHNSSSRILASELVSLLERTVSHAGTEITGNRVATEIVIGLAAPRTPAPHLFVNGNLGELVVSRSPSSRRELFVTPHPIVALLCACYITGLALNLAMGDKFQSGKHDPFIFEFSQLGLDVSSLNNEIHLGKTHLIGAGAIGNGFLWALRHLNVQGELHVVDYDHVDKGNLNRQIWFRDDDVSRKKASRLVERAQPSFSRLRLLPRIARMQELEERSATKAWLSRLIVAVDSRLARRNIQNEFPREVFDASTTDIREVVVHYHKQPQSDACLSCIYPRDEAETSREEHIADHLGVGVDNIRKHVVDAASAEIIFNRYPELRGQHLVGLAYDTLFKSLCGEGLLTTPNGRQIIAPFAFVSVLAGTLLALEVARRLQEGKHAVGFNYWRVSAWHPPFRRRQNKIPRNEICEFCSNKVMQDIALKFWGSDMGTVTN